MRVIPAAVAVNHSTFDKGAPDCEVYVYWMMMVKSVSLFPCIMEAGVSFLKLSQIYRSHSIL